MVSTIRLYVDASYAVAVMAFVGIVSGFAVAGLTGDTQRGLQAGLGMFALTGVALTIRLWRVTRRAAPKVDAATPAQD
jgi:hypothetical protein